MISKNIKYLRGHLGMTQADFGKLFKASRGMIDSYERGLAKPSLDLSLQIAEHFKITLDTLLNVDLKLNPGYLHPEGEFVKTAEIEQKLASLRQTIAELQMTNEEQKKELEFQRKIIEKLSK